MTTRTRRQLLNGHAAKTIVADPAGHEPHALNEVQPQNLEEMRGGSWNGALRGILTLVPVLKGPCERNKRMELSNAARRSRDEARSAVASNRQPIDAKVRASVDRHSRLFKDSSGRGAAR